MTISTAGTAELCLHAVGNENVGSGTGFGLELNQSGSSVLGITQASLLEFAADNPLTLSLNPVGTISFDCTIPDIAPLAAAGLVADLPPAGPSAAPASSDLVPEGEITPSMPLVIGTLPAGKGVVIVFQAAINDPLPTGITQVANQGTVSGTNFADVLTDDPATPAPNDPTITPIDTTVPQADLSLDKQADKTSAKPGETVTFTVTLTNIGPDAATGIQVADAIPASLTSVVVTPSGTTSYTSGVWSIDSLATSGMETLTITGEVVANGTTITNTAEVTAADQTDPVLSNNVASATVSVAEFIADLSLDKQADKTSAKPGETVTFTVTLTNIGPDAATGIQVTDAIPASLTSMVVTASGTTSYTNGVWSIGSLAASELETLTITGEVVANGTTITNTAEVTAADQTDPVSSNNIASATVSVAEFIADLSLDKQADKTSAKPGETVTFTVTLTNIGPDAATGIQVTDAIPASLTSVVVTPSGTTSYTDGVWSIDSLAASGAGDADDHRRSRRQWHDHHQHG